MGALPPSSRRSAEGVGAERRSLPHDCERYLTGFIDGTENPTLIEAPGITLIGEGKPGEGGTIPAVALTAYARVALASADVVIPELTGPRATRVATDAALLAERHRLVTVPVGGLEEALRACPVPLSTMGRSFDEDPEYFLAAAAAGRHAASLLRGTQS